MVLSVDELIVRVRSRIDELGPNDSNMVDLTDKDNDELDRIIKLSAPDALRYILLHGEATSLDGVDYEGTLTIDEELVGHLRLPEDMLRVTNVRLQSWRSSVPMLVTEESRIYAMQGDEYARGVPERPVAAIVVRDGGKELELYSAKDKEDRLAVCQYVRNPWHGIEEVGLDSYDVPQVLVNAFVYYTAGLTMTAYKEVDFGARLMAIANEMM